MAQIKKAQYGTILSRIDAINKENQELLYSPDISKEKKEQAAKMLQEYMAPPTSSYANYREMLQTKENQALQINEFLKNGTATTAATSEATSNSRPVKVKIRPFVTFNPTEGFNIYTTPTDTQDAKIKQFASELSRSLSTFAQKGYTKEDNVLKGISEDNYNELNNYIRQLNAISNKMVTDNNDIKQIGQIVSRLNNEDLHSLFTGFFSNALGPRPEETEEQKTAAQEAAAKEAEKYSNFLKVSLGDGSNAYIQLDPTSKNYQHAKIVKDGKETDVNLTDQQALENLGSKKWEIISNAIRQTNKNKFAVSNYGNWGGQDNIIDFSDYFPGMTKKDAEGKDVADLVIGDLSLAPDFNFDTSLWIPFEKIIQNWNNIKDTFSYAGGTDIDMNGNPTTHQYADSIGVIQGVDLSNISKLDQGLLSKMFIGYDFPKEMGKNGKFTPNDVAGYFRTLITATSEPGADPTKQEVVNAAKKALTSYSGINSEVFEKAVLKQNPEAIKALAAHAIKTAPDIYSKQAVAYWLKDYLELISSQKVTSNKQGGTLKFQQGSFKNWESAYTPVKSNTPMPSDDADKKSDSRIQQVKDAEKDEGFKWRTEDTLRTIALLSDLAGGFSSNAVGVGTAVSLGTGILSTLLDFSADTMDESVSDDQRRKNAYMNSGFTVLGAIPDAKFLTTGSKALKFISNIARRAGGIAALVGGLNLIKQDKDRIMELVNNPDSNQFTSDDLRLIFYTLQGIYGLRKTGIGVVGIKGKQGNKQKAISKAITQENRVIPLKNKEGKMEYVPMSETDFKEIVKKGRAEGTGAANKLMREKLGEKVADDAVMPIDFGENWTERWLHTTMDANRRWVLGIPTNSSYESYKLPYKAENINAILGRDKNTGWDFLRNKNGNISGWEMNYYTWGNHKKELGIPDAKPRIYRTPSYGVPAPAAAPAAPKAAPVAPSRSANSGTSSNSLNKNKKRKKKENGGKLLKLQNYINHA